MKKHENLCNGTNCYFIVGLMKELTSLYIVYIIGEPLPEVLWYLDNEVIDDSYQQTFEGTVKNGLMIRTLERKHTVGKLRCLASNNNITRPVESSVKLKMLCE